MVGLLQKSAVEGIRSGGHFSDALLLRRGGEFASPGKQVDLTGITGGLSEYRSAGNSLFQGA